MSNPDVDPGHPGPSGPSRPAGPRLDRAPGERYAPRGTGTLAGVGAGPPTAGPAPRRRAMVRALLAGDAVALAGAMAFFALGLVDIGPGTLAAAGAVGWAVALAIIWGGNGALPSRAVRIAAAAGLAAAAVILGLLLGWAWSRTEGGVLAPLDYLDQRYGALAWINVVVAAVAGAWRAR